MGVLVGGGYRASDFGFNSYFLLTVFRATLAVWNAESWRYGVDRAETTMLFSKERYFSLSFSAHMHRQSLRRRCNREFAVVDAGCELQ